MAEECLGDRRRVLEEEFFRKQEQAVLNQLRTAQAQQSAHEALAVATGVAGSCYAQQAQRAWDYV